MLGGSSGIDAVLILEGKINTVPKHEAGREGIGCGDNKEWTNAKDYSELNGNAENRNFWRNLASTFYISRQEKR